MNYVKKMCILRQIKQGFSGDGKALSGLVKIEQYGNNLAVEVSVINFAPLSSGEYYCLLSDGRGKTEMLALRGKSMFNILSDVDISGGFCAIICYVKNDVVPIAYGINGNGSYDWRTILNASLPPVFPDKAPTLRNSIQSNAADVPKQTAADFIAAAPVNFPPKNKNEGGRVAMNENSTPAPSSTTRYDDEKIVTENYYQEQKNEQNVLSENSQNAHLESTVEEYEENGTTLTENDDAESVLQPFKMDGDGYYLSVKGELDELFATYPRDNTLNGAFSCSEWVRVKGTAKEPQYLVGVLYEDGRAKFICYALAAQDKINPPDEIKNVCSFVPVSAFTESVGFFVIFQSATSGECIKPVQL